MKKPILIVTSFYYPDIAANVGLIKDLAGYLSQYFDVTVFTNKMRNSNYEIEEGEKRKHASISITRRYNPFVHNNGMLSKIFEYLFFMFQTYIYIKNRQQRFLVIFCQSTPPLMSIPIRLAAGKRSRIIYNVQDLFPDSLIPYFGDHHYIFLRKLEKASYNAADTITTICIEFYKKIKLGFHGNTVVIPNWVDNTEIYYVDKKENTISELLEGLDWNRKNIVYSGNIGINQDFDTVVHVAQEFSDCNFIIIGNGKRRAELQKKVKELGLNNFYFYNPLPKERILEIYSFGDVYLLPMKKNAMRASSPSKTWSILACGSPLVASVDTASDFARELSENQLAFVCEPENVWQLSEAIRLALLQNRKNAEKKIEYVRKNYDKQTVLTRYQKLFIEQL
jgi:glycosyltransferase involved in cell wall biosynthesis